MHQMHPISHVYLLLDGVVELTAFTALPNGQHWNMDTLTATSPMARGLLGPGGSEQLSATPLLWGARSLDVALLPSGGTLTAANATKVLPSHRTCACLDPTKESQPLCHLVEAVALTPYYMFSGIGLRRTGALLPLNNPTPVAKSKPP
jgi:hypothetical protein